MGVPYFYRWLKNKGFKGVLRRNVPGFVSSFSLDANGIIHQCAQLVYAYGEHDDPRRQKLIAKADPRMLEAEFYNAVSSKLQEIIAQVRPQETLVIAIDGVAPMGKITQQRQRRFRSAMERSDNSVFDSNCITPGTDFMIRLDNFLQRWIVSYQATLPSKVIYSSHMVPGEGEHKIMDLMRSGDISGEGAHVLYGMDADLIMLSMIAPLEHISLMREDIRDVIDIDTLKMEIQQDLVLPTAIHDFVVMIFTIGNDFLPHMPALEDLEEAISTLTDVYKQTGRSLTSDGDLDWEGLNHYLKNLALEEPRLLEDEAKRDVKFPSRMLQVASKRTESIQEGGPMIIGQKITFETKFDYNVFRGAWYQNELVPKGSDFNVVRQLLPGYNFGVTMDKVVEMCEKYLIGMAWVYNYYTKGAAAINSDFVYRYHHTPVLSDLAAVLDQVGKVEGYMAQPSQVSLNPIHQLLSVLPLKSKGLLPKEVTHLMTKDSPIADLYPQNTIIEMDGKNAEWQGIVLIPFVDPRRVIAAVNSTTMFTAERAKLYSQGSNIVIIRDPEMAELDKQRRGFRQFLEQEKQKRYGGRGKQHGWGRGDRGRGDNRGRGRDDNRGRGRDQGRGRGGYRKGDRTTRGDRTTTRDDRTTTRDNRPAKYTPQYTPQQTQTQTNQQLYTAPPSYQRAPTYRVPTSPTHAQPSTGLPPTGLPPTGPMTTINPAITPTQPSTGLPPTGLPLSGLTFGLTEPQKTNWKTKKTIL